MSTPMQYLIEGILPKHKLNIVAGPSGAGKTTFLFNMIRDWSQGIDVLGHKSNPEPYIYIALDRAADETEARIIAAGLDPELVPHLSILKNGGNLAHVMSQIPPGPCTVFIDGFARLCPGGKVSDYKVVGDFCSELTEMCEAKQLTIIAVLHATKVKIGEAFTHARHRVLGSVAWGGFSSTLIFIDECEPGKIGDNKRRVEVLPRNAKAEEFWYEVGPNGEFIQTNIEILAKKPNEINHYHFLEVMDLDHPYKATELMEMAERVGMKSSLVYELLKKWVADGTLKKTTDNKCYFRQSSDSINREGQGKQPPKPKGGTVGEDVD